MGLTGISLQIEKLMAEEGLNVIEATIQFAEINGIDIEEMGDLIDPILKEKLKTEFIKKNFFSDKKIENSLTDFLE